MPKRSYSTAAGYRYGFNGKENDNEVKGLGNQQDYGMRVYDPRIGKFLSVDPLIDKYPELTPYQFTNNSPVANVDLDGQEDVYYTITYNDQGKSKLQFVKQVDGLLCNCVGKGLHIEYNGTDYYQGSEVSWINKGFIAKTLNSFEGKTQKEIDASFSSQKTTEQQSKESQDYTNKLVEDVLIQGITVGWAYRRATTPSAATGKQQSAANNKTTTEGQKNSTNSGGTENGGGKNNQTSPQKAGAAAGTGSAGQLAKPVLYRGGSTFNVESNSIKVDPKTGLVQTSHGLSVNVNPFNRNVIAKGGAFEIVNLPKELKIIQRGKKDPGHFEIVPVKPMTVKEFQMYLNKIETKKLGG